MCLWQEPLSDWIKPVVLVGWRKSDILENRANVVSRISASLEQLLRNSQTLFAEPASDPEVRGISSGSATKPLELPDPVESVRSSFDNEQPHPAFSYLPNACLCGLPLGNPRGSARLSTKFLFKNENTSKDAEMSLPCRRIRTLCDVNLPS